MRRHPNVPRCSRNPSTTALAMIVFLAHAGLSAAAFASSGTDILVNDPALDVGGSTQSETSIAVAGDVVCIAFNDTGETIGGTGYAYSTNGGETFTDGGPFGPATLADPGLAYSARDEAFYFLAVGDPGFLNPAGLVLLESTDGCQTFAPLGQITTGGPPPNNLPFHDKSMIAIDNTPASPHYGRIHVTWMAASLASQTLAMYSDDSGGSWSPPVSLHAASNRAFAPWPAVAPNGDVYISVWFQSFFPAGNQDQLIFRSTDGGASWAQMSNIGGPQRRPENAPTSVACASQALNGDIRNKSSAQIAIHPDENASVGYVIHAVYSYDSDGAGADESNVFYARSTDGAQTWEPEVQLNDDATATDQFYPTLAVDENGVLAVSWYDRRLDPINNLLFDRYAVISEDGGLSFAANQRVSDVSSPVSVNLPHFDGGGKCYHGDYDQIAIGGDVVHVPWSDDRRTTAPGPNPDIYYDRISLDQDGDGVLDGNDNCLEYPNASQTDADQDGWGNACDCDLLNNGVCGIYDAWAMGWCSLYQVFPGCEPADMANDDLIIDEDDSVRFQEEKPDNGPSGLSCAGTIPCPQ